MCYKVIKSSKPSVGVLFSFKKINTLLHGARDENDSGFIKFNQIRIPRRSGKGIL
jgi:hypothetical protein